MDELVEQSLQFAALWNEVKDKLKQNALSHSGGQQHRLCIARALAIEEILLMDEPCSVLDPISTMRIEELIKELRQQYTIIIVTHNMQQASRLSQMTAFFNAALSDQGQGGYLAEFGTTDQIFSNPTQEATQDYVSGRFG